MFHSYFMVKYNRFVEITVAVVVFAKAKLSKIVKYKTTFPHIFCFFCEKSRRQPAFVDYFVYFCREILNMYSYDTLIVVSNQIKLIA